MKTAKKTSGLALATTAAAVFATGLLGGCANNDSKTTEVTGSTVGHCVGVNACKGTSSCATAGNACKGQNACKGMGYVKLDKATCDQLANKGFEAH